MAYSYDELQGSEQSVHEHPDHNFQDRVQLAGDVVPMPIQPQSMDQMIKTGGDKNAIYAKDSDKVTSYGTFLSKKFPLKDK